MAEKNPAVAVTLVGIVVYAIAGFAHLYFYGSLGVSLDEVGLGYTAILSKAALVLALALLVSAVVLASTAFIVFFFIGAFYSTDRPSFRRLDKMGGWGTLIILVMFAAVIVGFFREPIATIATIFCIFWFSFAITAIRLARRKVDGPSPLQTALAGAIMLWIVLASSLAAGFALRTIYGGSESVPPVWYWLLGLIFIPTLAISYLGFRLRTRAGTKGIPLAQLPLVQSVPFSRITLPVKTDGNTDGD